MTIMATPLFTDADAVADERRVDLATRIDRNNNILFFLSSYVYRLKLTIASHSLGYILGVQHSYSLADIFILNGNY